MSTNTGKTPKITVLETSRLAGEKMLEIFISEAEQAINKKGIFHLAVSGGNTPKQFFRMLSDSNRTKKLNWSKIHIFWTDERMVSPNSEHSNYKLAAETFINPLNINSRNIHPIPTENQNCEKNAHLYEKSLRETFNIGQGQIPEFDLIILGMGTDGHTASLFPKNDILKKNNKVKLAAPVKFHKNGLARITLTPPVLSAAKRITVLVCGEDKAHTLKKVFSHKPDKFRYPIHFLWEIPHKTTFILDKPAADDIEYY
jgi:6-phosphogluconolactonase